MSDAQAAVLAAAITGAIALVAIIATAVTAWRTLRYQRDADEQRRRHEQEMRVFDSGLGVAVDFLAAADRTTRASQGLDVAYTSLDGAKSSSDDKTYQHFRALWEDARETASAALADAENAYAALRILVPSVADQARTYLDLCKSAEVHPDEKKADRERARQTVEETIRRRLGGDLPGSLPAS